MFGLSGAPPADVLFLAILLFYSLELKLFLRICFKRGHFQFGRLRLFDVFPKNPLELQFIIDIFASFYCSPIVLEAILNRVLDPKGACEMEVRTHHFNWKALVWCSSQRSIAGLNIYSESRHRATESNEEGVTDTVAGDDFIRCRCCKFWSAL